MLVNVEHIISVRTALNGRLYARMENGEEILITRRCVYLWLRKKVLPVFPLFNGRVRVIEKYSL